jgi:hypothetical protein
MFCRGDQHAGLLREHVQNDTAKCWATATRFANGISITAAAAQAAAKATLGGEEDTEGGGANTGELSSSVRKYAQIDRERIADILGEHSDANAEWEKLQQVLYKRASVLRNTYVSSSSSGQGSEMDMKEFWRLVKQCKIVDKKFNGAVIDAIFVQVNKESGDKKDKDNATNPDKELVPTEFVEGLVRIAFQKFNPRNNVATPKKGPKESVSAATAKLIDQYIKGNVVQLLTGNYRKKLRDPLLKLALKETNSTLQKIFKKYSSSSIEGGKTLNIKEWALFNREFKLCNARYDSRAMQTAFIKSQDDPDSSESGDGNSNAEMIYAEFVEAIVTVACYKYPGPFMTIDKKASHLAKHDLIPAYQAMRRANQI